MSGFGAFYAMHFAEKARCLIFHFQKINEMYYQSINSISWLTGKKKKIVFGAYFCHLLLPIITRFTITSA